MNAERIAIVTGGSRGLGKDTVLALAKQGINIVFTYKSNAEKAKEVIEQVKQLGQKAIAFPLDTSTIKGFADFVQQVTSHLEQATGSPSFDYLINNAGISLNKSFRETTEEELDEMLNIHFKGVYFLTQQLLPYLKEGGSIVNFSSGLARFSFPGFSVYGPMKAAIESLSRYLAKELGEQKITVNTVAPGPIETDFGGGAVRDTPEVNAFMASLTALGRVGLPSDIGGVVSFLCSPAGHWINGQRIEVSGGILL